MERDNWKKNNPTMRHCTKRKKYIKTNKQTL